MASDDVDIARDRALVERHQAGDAHAFGELYRCYHDRLHRYCRRRVGDAHVAEELVQEAFLRAYRAIGTLEGERRFYPWLTVIAGRLCLDHLRRAGRVVPRSELDPGTVASAEDLLVEQARREQVRVALGRVRDRHRDVLRMRDWEEMSYEAIATTMDTPVTTVQSLLVRARQAVRREYLAIDGTYSLVPALGLVAAWRLRAARALQVWSAPASAASALPAAVLALAAVSVAVLAPPASSDPGAPAEVAAPATAIERATDEAPAALDPAPTAVQPPTAAPPAEPTSAVPAPAEQAAPPVAAPPPVLPAGEAAEVLVGAEGAEEGRRRAHEMPVTVDAGPGFAGVDAEALVESTVTDLTRRLEAHE
jgi:RNA polymerase sigma-70 factor, ECF subfamily